MTSTNNDVLTNQAIRPTESYSDRRCLLINDREQQQRGQLHNIRSCAPFNGNGGVDIGNITIRNNESSNKNHSDDQTEYEEQSRIAMKSLRPYDIICGRESAAFNNIGNRRFRILIGLNVKRYNAAEGRNNKGRFIRALVHEIVTEIGARFYKLKNGELTELTATQIRQKVGHALRDTLAFQESQQQQRKCEQRAPSPSRQSMALSSLRSLASNQKQNRGKSNERNSSSRIRNKEQTLHISPPPTPTQTSLEIHHDGDRILEPPDSLIEISRPSSFPVWTRYRQQSGEKLEREKRIFFRVKAFEISSRDSTNNSTSCDDVGTDDYNESKTRYNENNDDGNEGNIPLNFEFDPISIDYHLGEYHKCSTVNEICGNNSREEQSLS